MESVEEKKKREDILLDSTIDTYIRTHILEDYTSQHDSLRVNVALLKKISDTLNRIEILLASQNQNSDASKIQKKI